MACEWVTDPQSHTCLTVAPMSLTAKPRYLWRSLGPEHKVFISCWFQLWVKEELKAWVTPLLPSHHLIAGIFSLDGEVVKHFSCFNMSQLSFSECSGSVVEVSSPQVWASAGVCGCEECAFSSICGPALILGHLEPWKEEPGKTWLHPKACVFTVGTWRHSTDLLQ